MNNPMQLIQSVLNNKTLIAQNPLLGNATKLYQQNDVNGLKTLAENLCKERGMDINDIRQRLGI